MHVVSFVGPEESNWLTILVLLISVLSTCPWKGIPCVGYCKDKATDLYNVRDHSGVCLYVWYMLMMMYNKLPVAEALLLL